MRWIWRAFGVSAALAQLPPDPEQADAITQFVENFGDALSVTPKYLSICQIASPLAFWTGFNLIKMEERMELDTDIHLFMFDQQTEFQGLYEKFEKQYPDRFHLVDFDTFSPKVCSTWIMNIERSDWSVQDLLPTFQNVPNVMLGILFSGCDGDNAYAHDCRFMRSVWRHVTNGDDGICSYFSCLSMQPSHEISDPHYQHTNCGTFSDKQSGDVGNSQWAQDWYAFHNFYARRPDDDPNEPGVFVDVGAFHPFMYSNSLFFEQCLGWKGVLVEPNPAWAPYHRAYRKNAQLFQNCTATYNSFIDIFFFQKKNHVQPR